MADVEHGWDIWQTSLNILQDHLTKRIWLWTIYVRPYLDKYIYAMTPAPHRLCHVHTHTNTHFYFLHSIL